MKKWLIASALSCTALTVSAHGGEDHGEAAAAPPPAQQAPRASAQTDDFELVAVLTGLHKPGASEHEHPSAGPVLTLYLDHYASNAPVAGATVEVESGAFKAVAQQVAPGEYTVAAVAFAQPGRYPLTVSVQTQEGADLLDAVLQYQAPASAASAPTPIWFNWRDWRSWGSWAAGLVLLLAAAAWLRRRTVTRKLSR